MGVTGLLMGINPTTSREYHGRLWNIMDANCRRYGTQPWFPVPKMFHIHGGFSIYMLIYCRVAINLNDTTSEASKWMTMIAHGQKCVFFLLVTCNDHQFVWAYY